MTKVKGRTPSKTIPMRTNLPVSQQEFVIPDGVTLVSTTDLTLSLIHI